jgi:hypothetical protein
MPYYNTGDYYGRGDYYQGDGIFSSIGKVLGTVVRTVGTLATGGVAGLVTGGLKGAVTGTAAAIPVAVSNENQRAVLAAGGSESALTPELMMQHQAAIARGVMPPMIMAPGGPGLMLGSGMGLMLPRGYRPNKSTYAVRGGGTSRWPAGMLRLIAKGTVPVKSRRMNVANPRALRRGLRRAAGFVKLARRAHVRLAAFTRKGTRKKK